MIVNPVVTPPTDLPTGQRGQSFERRTPTAVLAIVSGRLTLTPIYLRAGDVVSTLTFVSSTTALATPSHGWAALYDPSLALVGQSANDTSIAWAANTPKAFTLATPITITTTGWYYAGVAVVATTTPTLVAVAPYNGGVGVGSMAPVMGGFYNSSLTSTAPATATSFTAASIPYCCWA